MAALDRTGIWRRDMCVCGRSIIRDILTTEPWSHWGGTVQGCAVATPRRTSAGDVLVAGPQDGGAR